MQSSLIGSFLVTILAVIVECRNIEGECPPATRTFGICIFRPGVNCISDSECGEGKLCCRQSCGRVCKTAVHRVKRSVNPGQCPDTGPIFTTCQFIQGVNCIFDSECSSNEKCCYHGCTNICKVSV